MAYGKKNHVNLDILSYSVCLLGESKIGKTTLVKQVLEKLAGEDGYLFLELGQERGADAIEGINYINCPAWEMEYDLLMNSAGFYDVCNDIIENKTTEYKDLKVVVWDTYDQLISMAEKEAIRLWNKECREKNQLDKIAKGINGAWGGFGKGDKKAMDLMFDMKARLEQVGVQTFVIGHVKTKDVTDIMTGLSYQTITSDQQQNYFNALKKIVHFLGLAYIDRTIQEEKTGKKNIVTGKEIVKSFVKEEKRKIKFRDDNYAIDSGSRFADIIPEINLDPDEFIKALTDAILAEQSKSGKTVEETRREQEELKAKEAKRIAERESEEKRKKELFDLVNNNIVPFFIDNKANIDKIRPIMSMIKGMSYSSPLEINDIDDAKKIVETIKSQED